MDDSSAGMPDSSTESQKKVEELSVDSNQNSNFRGVSFVDPKELNFPCSKFKLRPRPDSEQQWTITLKKRRYVCGKHNASKPPNTVQTESNGTSDAPCDSGSMCFVETDIFPHESSTQVTEVTTGVMESWTQCDMSEIKRSLRRGHFVNKGTQTAGNKRVHSGVQTEGVSYIDKEIKMELLCPSTDDNISTLSNRTIPPQKVFEPPSLTTKEHKAVSTVKRVAVALKKTSQKTKPRPKLNRTNMKDNLQDPTLINPVDKLPGLADGHYRPGENIFQGSRGKSPQVISTSKNTAEQNQNLVPASTDISSPDVKPVVPLKTESDPKEWSIVTKKCFVLVSKLSEKSLSDESSQANKSNVPSDVDTLEKTRRDEMKDKKKHLLICDSSDTESVKSEKVFKTTQNNSPHDQNISKKIENVGDKQASIENIGNPSKTDDIQVTNTKHSEFENSDEELHYVEHAFAEKLKERRRYRISFTEEDRRNIVRFIIKDGCKFQSLGGIDFWKMVEMNKVCPGHTWQSIKEHYRKRILPVLDAGGPTEANLKKFLQMNSETLLEPKKN